MKKYSWRIIKRKLTPQEKADGIIYRCQISHDKEIGPIHTVNKNDENWRQLRRNLKRNTKLKRIAKANNYLVVEIIWT